MVTNIIIIVLMVILIVMITKVDIITILNMKDLAMMLTIGQILVDFDILFTRLTALF